MARHPRAGAWALAVVSLLLAACSSQPRLILPEDPAAQACVAACGQTRQRCVSFERSEAESIAAGCDNTAQVEQCVERAVDDRTTLACQARQRHALSCPGSTPNLAPCEEAYTLCALRCGARLAEP